MSTSPWAKRRKRIYGTGALILVAAVLIPIIFYASYTPPTCFDGKRNQGETDIDKGGPCKLLDARFIQPLSVQWARPFLIRHGFYNAVAYIENVNREAGIKDIIYKFRLYDSQNILVAERTGRTPIYPAKVFPIFESRIGTGERIPVRATFEFISPKKWEKMQDATKGIRVSNTKFDTTLGYPRITAEVKNNTLDRIRRIVLVATVFDTTGNAINASHTFLNKLDAGETQEIAFTWPEQFKQKVARIDVVPLVEAR